MASNAAAFSELATLRRQMTVVGSGAFVREVKGAFAIESVKLIGAGFGTKTAPDGTSWAPRKPSKATHPLLQKTKRLLRGWRARPTERGIEITTEVPYARYHQDGTAEMPARRMVPFNLRFLPEPWAKEFKAAEAKIARRYGL